MSESPEVLRALEIPVGDVKLMDPRLNPKVVAAADDCPIGGRYPVDREVGDDKGEGITPDP